VKASESFSMFRLRFCTDEYRRPAAAEPPQGPITGAPNERMSLPKAE
jgi:hypothetical protein